MTQSLLRGSQCQLESANAARVRYHFGPKTSSLKLSQDDSQKVFVIADLMERYNETRYLGSGSGSLSQRGAP